tara:strand:- start:123 stop:566 length:444 start_codon:yes stop_codon:yes gene_type:complete
MVRKNLISIIVINLIIFMTGCIFYYNSFHNTANEKKLAMLTPVVRIVDSAKFSILPTLFSNTLQFNITIETYENADLLNLNLVDFSIIKCDQTILQNIQWNIKFSSDHKISGNLTADFVHSDYIQHCFPIHLDLFLNETTSFTWNSI